MLSRSSRLGAFFTWAGLICLVGGIGFAADTKALDKRLQQEVGETGFASLSVGIVQGDTLVYSAGFGWADHDKQIRPTPHTLYRIGSITKVFTTTLLGILRDEGVLRLDDPIRLYLPKTVRLPSEPSGDSEITFRHLATHTSGLPRDPVNLQSRPGDPFGDYSVALLYEGLAQTKLVTPIGQQILYSNLGMGLLGHVLSLAAKKPYAELLQSRIFKPLAMKQSTTTPNGPLFAHAYTDGTYQNIAKVWHLGEIEPAGVIGSSVSEMAAFLALQLRAGEGNVNVVRGSTLAELHRPQRIFDGWMGGIGLGWLTAHQESGGDIVWHNGGLDGYYSYLGFSPFNEVGVIVLSSGGKGADQTGKWLLKEAVTLFSTRTIDDGARKAAEALGNHFVAKPGDDLGDLFNPDFLKAIPLEQIKPIMASFHKKLGPCTGIAEMKPTEFERRIRINFTFEKGSSICILGVDKEKKARINYLLFPN